MYANKPLTVDSHTVILETDMYLKINGGMKEFDGTDLYCLIESLDLDPSRVAVELNGNIVPRSEFKETSLKDDDSLEIVHFVGGG